MISLAESDLGNASAVVTEVVIWHGNSHVNSEMTGVEEIVQLMEQHSQVGIIVEHSEVRYYAEQCSCAIQPDQAWSCPGPLTVLWQP